MQERERHARMKEDVRDRYTSPTSRALCKRNSLRGHSSGEQGGAGWLALLPPTIDVPPCSQEGFMAATLTQAQDAERDSLGKHSLPATDGSRPFGANSDGSQRESSDEWNLEPAASGLIARVVDISVLGTSTSA